MSVYTGTYFFTKNEQSGQYIQEPISSRRTSSRVSIYWNLFLHEERAVGSVYTGTNFFTKNEQSVQYILEPISSPSVSNIRELSASC